MADASRASELKDKGNRLFAEGRYKEASECYTKAAEASPMDPVYPSNLSAVFYESNKYPEAIDAIIRSWELIGPEGNATLALKLSHRLVKSLSHGFRDGSVSREVAQRLAISELELAARMLEEVIPAAAETVLFWSNMRRIEMEEVGDRIETVNDARERLSTLPIFRKTPVAFLEYYTIGNDPPMSIMDDWGPERDISSPLKLGSWPQGRLGQTSFLFGGVGDARHVYGSLIGAHASFMKLTPPKRKKFRLHITLLDLQPAALARDLVMLMLLNDLVEHKDPKSVDYLEQMTTVFYTYTATIMPDYCEARLQKTMKDLRKILTADTLTLPRWIHLDPIALPGILDILDYWTTDVKKDRNISGLLSASGAYGTIDSLKTFGNLSASYEKMLEEQIARNREGAARMIDMNPSACGLTPPTSRSTPEERRLYEKQREVLITKSVEMMMESRGGDITEKTWYDQTKVFIPPPELWSRHPNFEVARGMKGGGNFPSGTLPKIQKHISQTWSPNWTLFYRHPKAYTEIGLDAWTTPTAIKGINERLKISTFNDRYKPDAPAFTHLNDFFGGVVKALKTLKDQVTLEVLYGELTQELSKMRCRGDRLRPPTFPRAYTRSYLSNVPDYTHGIINMIIYGIPCLQSGSESAVAASCLLNTGIWKTDDEFVHNYTLLAPGDLPRYLGCYLICKEAVKKLIVIGKKDLPRPLTELASRQELVAWLTRVFVYTVLPGAAGRGPVRVRMPNNLIAFFGLINYLPEVGYPAHWIADLVQGLLSGKMTTDIAPYQGQWPIPLSDMRRRVARRAVRTDPWLLDMENVFAVSQQGFPFAVSLPLGFASSHREIGTYYASGKCSMPMMGTGYSGWPDGDPTVSFLFYKPSGVQGMSAEKLVALLPDIFEGKECPLPGNVYVLTSPEAVVLPNLRWRMSKARVKQMKAEKWCMVGYRIDSKAPFTFPVPAHEWKEL